MQSSAVIFSLPKRSNRSIEGDEFSSLARMLASGVLCALDVLAIEIHDERGQVASSSFESELGTAKLPAKRVYAPGARLSKDVQRWDSLLQNQSGADKHVILG